MPKRCAKRPVKTYERKVWVRRFLAAILDMSPRAVGNLFGYRRYYPEAIRLFLAKQGYVPPVKRPRGRPKKTPVA